VTAQDRASRELAARTGLSAGYLNHLVKGKRGVPEGPVLEEIAKALRVDPRFFLDWRLAKVVEALVGKPDVVNELFAKLGDSDADEPSSRAMRSAAEDHSKEENDGSLGETGDRSLAVRGGPNGGAGYRCVVPGCTQEGKHKLGVRCRVWHEPSPVPGKSRTSALWSPDSDALLCDEHALGGADITLIYEPNDSGETAA
jgi:transcriptional regulator with XRE-family HTH domain